jgi:hypothetical protein
MKFQPQNAFVLISLLFLVIDTYQFTGTIFDPDPVISPIFSSYNVLQIFQHCARRLPPSCALKFGAVGQTTGGTALPTAPRSAALLHQVCFSKNMTLIYIIVLF